MDKRNNNLLALSSQTVSRSDIEEGTLEQIYAAVDLGSNSFHMVVARYQHGEFTVIERQRESVRLASGLDDDGILSKEVAKRALLCLTQFGQLLRPLLKQNIRVVGTNALRRLANKARFLNAAEQALGCPIDIVAGREEARLIYLGVSRWQEMGQDKNLVIDIGGGSTEVIIGQNEQPICRESLEVGCVVLTQRFFADGVLSAERFDLAVMAAELAIQPVVKQYRGHGWKRVLGCSGTMRSIEKVLVATGLVKEGIAKSALDKLLAKVLEFKCVEELDLPALDNDRKQVFAGGLSVIVALFHLFDITEMAVSDIALREGVLYDLIGRSNSHDDIRNNTVTAMLSRWAVESWRGERVKNTALFLYKQVASDWGIDDSLYELMLGWAAQLHELGLLVSHDKYHKHGAYVIENADMAGFTKRDQLLLAALVLGHRRKFPIDRFEELPVSLVTPAKRLCVILRLAVLLHRDQSESLEVVEQLSVVAQGAVINLQFLPAWLEQQPLTKADLLQEKQWLKTVGIKLKFY